MTCDWMRADHSHSISGSGFISSCSTVQVHLPENTERKPASQTGSQLDRKRSSKGERGCLGWFMLCSRMLNEFRVHCYYSNWLNGHCLHFSDTYLLLILFLFLEFLNGNSQNAVLLPHIIVTWNFQYIERQIEKEMNHCRAPIWISCQ